MRGGHGADMPRVIQRFRLVGLDPFALLPVLTFASLDFCEDDRPLASTQTATLAAGLWQEEE